MKRITLEALRLQNFRGARDVEVRLTEGCTTIAGDNGTGKSTLYDAFLWLLFGKDAADRKDYEVKRIEDGEPIRRTDATVEGSLRVDGRVVRLRRTFAEDWMKPRGATEPVFKGNHTNYFIDDAPLKMSDYDRRVAEMMAAADVFRLITDAWGFTHLHWEKQRAKLFELAGGIDEQALKGSVAGYNDLLQRLSGKPTADYRRELAARKRKLKKELEAITPRVDQTQRMMPQDEPDRAALSAELASVDAALEALDKEAADFAEAERAKHEAERQRIEAAERAKLEARRRRMEAIETLKTRLMQCEATLRRSYEAEQARQGDGRRALELRLAEAEAQERSADRMVRSATDEVEGLARRIKWQSAELARLRAEWHTEYATEMTDPGLCPHCGQPLPEEMKADARRRFDEGKQRRLKELRAEGIQKHEEVKAYEATLEELGKKREAEIARRDEVHTEIERLRTELQALPEPEPAAAFDPKQDATYTQLLRELEACKAEPEPSTPDAPTEPAEAPSDAAAEAAIQRFDGIARRQTLTRERDRIQASLADCDTADRLRAEVARLEEEGRDLAQQIADAERDEDILQRYTRARIEAVEQRVNGLFRHVRFRLFDYTNDGAEFETCIPLVGAEGIPYPVANTAAQVWAGLDIIRVLQEHAGVSAPVFIDGAERVTSLPEMAHQTILLAVAPGVKPLRVTCTEAQEEGRRA